MCSAAMAMNRAYTVKPFTVRLAVAADYHGSLTVAFTSAPPGPL